MSTGQKEIILAKIKKALSKPVPEPFSGNGNVKEWFQMPDDDLAILFAQKFVELQGQFAWCLNLQELQLQLKQLFEKKAWNKIYCADEQLRNWLNLTWHNNLSDCHAAITYCDALVARTGTIVLSSSQTEGRTASVYAPVHICIAFSSQLVPNTQDALISLQNKYAGKIPSLISFASGPSRTADIEKTLVTGVHGPKEVFCFLMDD